MAKKNILNSTKEAGKKEQYNVKESSMKEAEDSLESKPESKGEGVRNYQKEIQEIRKNIEKAEIGDSLKMQAASQAQTIKGLDKEEKIKSLLKIAKRKGVVFAVHVAKKMNDPYILDMLHDILAKEGYYKKFTK